jgi:hypothetical protein
MADPQPPPPQGFRWNWGEFAFAIITNVASALVTAAVIYLGGVVGGYWKANPYTVLAAASLLLVPVLGAGVRLSVKWAESRWGREQP